MPYQDYTDKLDLLTSNFIKDIAKIDDDILNLINSKVALQESLEIAKKAEFDKYALEMNPIVKKVKKK